MSWKHDHYMTLTDGREVLVDYVVEDLGSEPSGMSGPPEHYDPGSGPELYVEKVTIDDGTEEGVPVEITDAEREHLEREIADNPDWWMPDLDDYPEPDWSRD